MELVEYNLRKNILKLSHRKVSSLLLNVNRLLSYISIIFRVKVLFIAFFLLLLANYSNSQIVIDDKYAPDALVQKILIGKNSGIRIEQVKYIGDKKSIGSYATFTKCMPISSGIVLSTGLAKDIDGPNESSNTGTKIF